MIKNIAFIDRTTTNHAALIASFDADTAWYLISPEEDGLAQMQGALAAYSNLDSIKVISHGSSGNLHLGSTRLNSGNIADYANQLWHIGSSLSAIGDIQLYGCDIARGSIGEAFIGSLAEYTGRDIAASTNATGATTLGGDWILEAQTGNIEAAALVATAYAGLLLANTAPRFEVGDGMITTAIGSGGDHADAVALQPDGRIVLAGLSTNSNNSDFALTRYHSNGKLDSAFGGGDGMLTTAIGTNAEQARSIALQGDGKILVAGTSSYSNSIASFQDFALLRYNIDGSLDSSFGGGDGVVITDVTQWDDGRSIALQSDGKILLAGYTSNGSTNSFALIRYNNNGTLDSSFGGGDGIVSSGIGHAYSVAQQPDGKILVAGDITYGGGSISGALLRYNTDGNLDSTFGGGDGIVINTPALIANSIAIQPDGKILLAGSATKSTGNTSFALMRYNTDGTPDIEFGAADSTYGDGLMISDLGSGADQAYSVTLQADGKILVAGDSYNGSNLDFALVRYTSSGIQDPTFSSDGIVTANFGSGNDHARSVAVQADGKIIVGGYAATNGGEDFALLRYNTDGSLDLTFDEVGNTLDGTSSFTEGGSPVVLDSNVQIDDAELAAKNNYAGASLSVSRHNGASNDDQFSGAGIVAGQASGSVMIASTTLGTYTWVGGTLTIVFSSGATQPLVNQAMQSLAYLNKSDAPPASLQLDWTFSDGNTTAQGTGGALSCTGSTTVNLTGINDAPSLTAFTSTIANTIEDTQTAVSFANLQALSDAKDIDGNITGYIVTTVSNGTLLIGNSATTASPWAAGSNDVIDSTRLAYWTPTPNTFGVPRPAFSVIALDNNGAVSTLPVQATISITAVNDPPTGSVVISGTPVQGQILTASNTLADPEGIAGTISYQWRANGLAIANATGNTFTLGADAVGSVISVTASYTDSGGTLESRNSASTPKVLNGQVTGSPGNDTLMGSYTADTLAGGAGNDIYYINHSGDLVIENSDAGLDTVYCSLSRYTLGANIENGRITGSMVSLTGNSLANTFYAGDGNDTLNGGTGSETDTVTYADAVQAVTISLASTVAQVTGGSGTDLLLNIENVIGSNHNDSLSGNSSSNVLDGGSGNDTLIGNAGSDTLLGGQGDDIYFVDAAGDTLVESAAGGNDSVWSSYAGNYLMGPEIESGRITSNGAAGLIGNALGNTLYAGIGDNFLDGGSGSEIDTVSYQYGLPSGATTGVQINLSAITSIAQNTVSSGSDTLINIENLIGSSLNDIFIGNAGANVLDGGLGNDTLVGGLGNDSYVINTASDVIFENPGEGIDTVNVLFSGYTLGNNLEDARISTNGTANLTGNSLANTLYAGGGNNILNGGTGNESDTVSYADANLGVTVSLAIPIAQATGGSGSDTLLNIENLSGSSYNDTLTGSISDNILNGGTGADIMIGGEGADSYYVENSGDIVFESNASATGGQDTVYSELAAYTLTANVENGVILSSAAANLSGNSLNNTLYAGTGNNLLLGDAGIDTLSYVYGVSGKTGVSISLLSTVPQNTGGSGTDLISGFENLTGSIYDDALSGNAISNVLNGGAGNDTLQGGAGADKLNGGSGGDRLLGGPGKDNLTGGPGNDIFKLLALTDSGVVLAARDVITDFTSGQDKIDLLALDANSATTINDAFSFIGTAGFSTNATGQLRYEQNTMTGTLIIYGSTDADAVAEFSLQLNGVSMLTSSNFLL